MNYMEGVGHFHTLGGEIQYSCHQKSELTVTLVEWQFESKKRGRLVLKLPALSVTVLEWARPLWKWPRHFAGGMNPDLAVHNSARRKSELM